MAAKYFIAPPRESQNSQCINRKLTPGQPLCKGNIPQLDVRTSLQGKAKLNQRPAPRRRPCRRIRPFLPLPTRARFACVHGLCFSLVTVSDGPISFGTPCILAIIFATAGRNGQVHLLASYAPLVYRARASLTRTGAGLAQSASLHGVVKGDEFLLGCNSLPCCLAQFLCADLDHGPCQPVRGRSHNGVESPCLLLLRRIAQLQRPIHARAGVKHLRGQGRRFSPTLHVPANTSNDDGPRHPDRVREEPKHRMCSVC